MARQAEWKTLNILDGNSLKEIRSISKEIRVVLQDVQRILGVGEQIIDTVEQYVELLKLMESISNNQLYAFLNVFIDQLQNMVNNVKSTGVYCLDLFTYHLQDDPSLQEIQSDKLNGNAWYAIDSTTSVPITDETVILKSLQNDPYAIVLKQLHGYLGELLVNIPNIEEKDKSYRSQITYYINAIKQYLATGQNPPDIKELKSKIIDKVSTYSDIKIQLKSKLIASINSFQYKTETYNEFIQTICDAFTDENDVPGPGISEWVNKKNNATDEKKAENNQKTGSIVLDIKNSWNSISDQYLRSGRPEFGPDGYMMVILLGFSFFDYNQLASAINAIKQIVNSFATDWKFKDTLVSGSFESNVKENMAWGYSKDREQSYNAQEPNFIGMSLNSLFPQIWEYIDKLLNNFKQLTSTFSTSVFDVVEEYADMIRKMIKKIKHMVLLIEALIEIIDGLLTLTQGYMLMFDTNEGVTGVIEKLKTAKNFYKTQAKRKEVSAALGIEADIELQLAMMDGAKTSTDMINNIQQYRNGLLPINETQLQDYETQNAAYQASVSKNQKLLILRDQCNAFSLAITASNYDEMIAAIAAQNVIYDGQIAAYNTLRDDALNATYSLLWLTDQIENATAELEPTSTFNEINTQNKANAQAQIDALDAQQADQYAPKDPDYATKKAALEDQIDVFDAQKADHDTLYTDKRDRYTATKALIDAFILANPIITAADITVYTNKISDLHDDRDDLTDDRAAYIVSYNNDVAAQNLIISNANASITSNQSDIITNLNNIAQWNAEIALYQATDYNPPSASNSPSSSPDADPPYETYGTEIADREGWIAAAEAENITLNNAITTLIGNISTAQNQLITLENNKIAYETQAFNDEEDNWNETQAYVYWVDAETARLDGEAIEIVKEEYNISAMEDVNDLLTSIREANVPALTDNSYTAIINELVNQEHFSVIMPDPVRVSNLMSKTSLEEYRLNLMTQLAYSKYEETNNLLNTKLSQDNIDSNYDAVVALDAETQFDPDEKMYFGGVLFCFGYPGTQSSFNLSEALGAAAQEVVVSSGEITKVAQNTEEIIDLTKKTFSTLLKR